jgi:hypothetical protein
MESPFAATKELEILWRAIDALIGPSDQKLSRHILTDTEWEPATDVMRLGLYDSLDANTCPSGEPIFPSALRWDSPVYLVRGNPNC